MWIKALVWIIQHQLFGWVLILWQIMWGISVWSAAAMIEHGNTMLGTEYDVRKLFIKGLLILTYAFGNWLIMKM